MENVFLVIAEHKWLVAAHLVTALLIVFLYVIQSGKFGFTKGKTVLFGAVFSMDRRDLIAWAISISRFITVCYCAARPEDTGLIFAGILVLMTFVLNLLAGDMPGLLNQSLTYIVISVLILLKGLFLSYCREVEDLAIIRIIAWFLGCFAILYSLFQTIRGHEQLILLSNGIAQGTAKTEKKKRKLKIRHKESPDRIA